MEDAEIVGLFWERSEQAIAEMRQKYGRMCSMIARNILDNEQDCEECVNDTYLATWNAIPEARPCYLGAFVARIVRNIALDRLDYVTAGKRNGMHQSLDEMEQLLPSQAEQQYDALLLADLLNRFLKTQTKQSRVIFLRRYWLFEPVEEIAARYRISKGAVNQMIFRVRRKLEKYLREEDVL